ncbi:uncharacterized protein V6R79_007070 [Siganus canaliculatus]
MPVEPKPVTLSEDQIDHLRREVDVVIDQMKSNVEGILQREANMSNLLDKTQEMEEGAKGFKRVTTKVSWAFCCKNVKLVVVMVVVVLIIVLVIVLLATGVIPTSSPLHPTVTPTTTKP